MNNIFLALGLILILSSSQLQGQGDISAQQIVDKCIIAHGGKAYEKAMFSFDFRDKHYTYKNDNGKYQYTREFSNKANKRIKDVLTNDGFNRFEDGLLVDLDTRKSKGYGNSVNSVHYFAFLPFFLNDPAVQKKYLGENRVKGKDYYKIRVIFAEEGGGSDFEDIYVYWINKNTFTMDYLAYSFHVNKGGVRFREAINSRVVGGVRFQDYINYKHDKDTPVESLDQFFIDGTLTELSRIELKNIVREESE